MNKYIVIRGSLLKGFTYTGPFESEHDAWDYDLDATDYWVAELAEPVAVLETT